MTAICCNQCFETIAKKDTAAGRLWIDLCACFVKYEGVFKMKETMVPHLISHLRNLEKLGFVSTADVDDAVRVRVNGYDVVLDKESELCLDTFCLDREAHKSSWV